MYCFEYIFYCLQCEKFQFHSINSYFCPKRANLFSKSNFDCAQNGLLRPKWASVLSCAQIWGPISSISKSKRPEFWASTSQNKCATVPSMGLILFCLKGLYFVSFSHSLESRLLSASWSWSGDKKREKRKTCWRRGKFSCLVVVCGGKWSSSSFPCAS